MNGVLRNIPYSLVHLHTLILNKDFSKYFESLEFIHSRPQSTFTFPPVPGASLLRIHAPVQSHGSVFESGVRSSHSASCLDLVRFDARMIDGMRPQMELNGLIDSF
jgi:hypothetical protein